MSIPEVFIPAVLDGDPDDVAQLARLLYVLRQVGISRLSVDEVAGFEHLTVTFGHATAVLEAAAAAPKSIAQALSDLEATDKCKCGHTEAAHNSEGECLQGCELEVCYPGNEPPPKPEATLEG